MSASGCKIRFMASNTRKRRSFAGGNDREGKRIQYGRICCRVPGRRQLFGWRPGKALDL